MCRCERLSRDAARSSVLSDEMGPLEGLGFVLCSPYLQFTKYRPGFATKFAHIDVVLKLIFAHHSASNIATIVGATLVFESDKIWR